MPNRSPSRRTRVSAVTDDIGPLGPFRLLVVGVDGSEGSRRALAWAARLSTATGAQVLVVHVLTYSRELIHDVMPETMHTWRRELENKLRTQWVAPLVAAGIDHTAAVVEGDSPAEALLDVAHREHADLLVVGANGHGGISRRVLGGLIRVTHRARQPVVVVPPDWAAPQGCG